MCKDEDAWLQEELKDPDFRNFYRELDRMYAMIDRLWHLKREQHWTSEYIAAMSGLSVKTVDECFGAWYTSSRTIHLGYFLLRVLGQEHTPLPRSNRYRNQVKAFRLATWDRDVLSIPPRVLRGILQGLDNMAAGKEGVPSTGRPCHSSRASPFLLTFYVLFAIILGNKSISHRRCKRGVGAIIARLG